LSQDEHLEIENLKARLEEAESTLEAIRSGAVDALVVRSSNGDQVFTLRGADEPYRIFVEQMQEGAVTLDDSGTILYSNLAFANIVGEPLERVIGTQFDCFLPEYSGAEANPFSAFELGRMEMTLSSTKGPVPVLCSASLIEIEGPTTYAITVTDLTAQKEHEAQLTFAKNELEGFCYSVSHDLRSPLRGIISGASIVVEDFGHLLPETAIRDLARIGSSANHLALLMDDLLTYARLSTQVVLRQGLDLTSLAQKVAAGVPKFGEDEIVWTIEEGLAAEADPRFIELVINNLFFNSAKFSSQSKPPRIQFGKDQEKKAFYIRDNGIGFSMEFVEKLFKPFERLHRQADYPGTGIGLANVKRIITRHGGQVWAEGEEGKGATFYFTLP